MFTYNKLRELMINIGLGEYPRKIIKSANESIMPQRVEQLASLTHSNCKHFYVFVIL